MKKKRVSLSSEIHCIMLAIQGLRLLAVRLIDTPEDPEANHIATSLASLTTLVVERARLVERAVCGTIDPRLVWNRENDATGLDELIVLESWREPAPRPRVRDPRARDRQGRGDVSRGRS
jgi:hypothetical protein